MSETAAHPTPKLYWIIALILAVVTAVEVAIPSIPALDPIKVPALLISTKEVFVSGDMANNRFCVVVSPG